MSTTCPSRYSYIFPMLNNSHQLPRIIIRLFPLQLHLSQHHHQAKVACVFVCVYVKCVKVCVCVGVYVCCSFKASFQAQVMPKARQRQREMVQLFHRFCKAKEKGKSCTHSGSRCSYINCMCFSFVFHMHVCVYLCLNCEVLMRNEESGTNLYQKKK